MKIKTIFAVSLYLVIAGCNDSRLGATQEIVGPTGATGLSSLIATNTEPAGSNCPFGGTKITTGLDDNGDQILDEAEIDSTAYVCNGEPGPAGGPQRIAFFVFTYAGATKQILAIFHANSDDVVSGLGTLVAVNGQFRI